MCVLRLTKARILPLRMEDTQSLKKLPLGEEYIANDVVLNRTLQQIIMITGPNMSGKSAILRQTALIVLLAQMGSYVPAQECDNSLGLVDKSFYAGWCFSDNISIG